jgi:hypothetical protein
MSSPEDIITEARQNLPFNMGILTLRVLHFYTATRFTSNPTRTLRYGQTGNH